MAVTVVAGGTQVVGASAASSAVVTVGAIVAVNDGYFVEVVFKNSNSVSSISDQAGNSGVQVGAHANATSDTWTEVWFVRCASQLSASQTTTVNFSGSTADTCVATITLNGTTASNSWIQCDKAAVTNSESTTTGFGSESYASLPSKARVWLMCGGKAANSTTAITASTNFTSAGFTIRSRNNSAACILRSEWRINTSTGETSNPTLAVSGDASAVFIAFEQVNLKTLTATEAAASQIAKTANASKLATSAASVAGSVWTVLTTRLATAASGAALAKTAGHVRSATSAASASLSASHVFSKALLAVQAASAQLARSVGKVLTAAQSAAVSAAKGVAHAQKASSAASASTSASHTFAKALLAVQGAAATVVRTTLKALAAAGTAAVARQASVGAVRTATSSAAATQQRQVGAVRVAVSAAVAQAVGAFIGTVRGVWTYHFGEPS